MLGSSAATPGARCSAIPNLDTPRGRALQSFSNFFLHVYPVKIPKRVLRMRYSFRLGFIAAVLFGILLVTGIYLMFVYTPSVGSAYGDMQHLKTGVGFGQLIRNVHRWAAHLMVLVVALHLVRVFYAGAYKKPREFNWVIGVMLLLLTLGALVHRLPAAVGPARRTGPSPSARTSCTTSRSRRQAPGPPDRWPQVGQNTLLRFYALHVAVLPMLLVLMLSVHIWRVRKDGFAVERAERRRRSPKKPPSARPRRRAAARHGARRAGALRRARPPARRRRPRVDHRGSATVDDTVFTWPHLLVRHVVVALGTAAVVLGLGVAFSAPLRGLANPNLTPEPAKAPWYFAGLQELLSHFDPLVAGILMPARRGARCFVLLPYIDRNP